MEFVCEKKEIQSGVQAVDRIVATRSTLPIIGNILFEAATGGVKLSANNLEIGIKLGVNATVVKSGAVLLPAKTLSGIVAKLPETAIGFKLGENGMVKISYNGSHFNIHSLPPDEFPALPTVKEVKSFSIDPQVFLSMIKQTIFSVSTSEEKYVLTGVLFDLGSGLITGDGPGLQLVATDGYRLAKRGEKIELSGVGGPNIVVPARALTELSRILEGKSGKKLKVVTSADQVCFQYEDVYLVSRLIQGEFPDYKQVAPKKSATQLTVNTKKFLESAERAAVVASGSANITRFEVREGKMHILANTPDVGSVDEVLDVDLKGADKVQVSFNIRLITDVLKVINTERTVLELSEALGPGVIRPEGKKEDYLYIVMPIRTQEGA